MNVYQLIELDYKPIYHPTNLEVEQ